MAEPFLGEIRSFAFPVVPRGWALCNGQLLQISQNQALFTILGATYGGDGRTTFALPNLMGRAAVHPGSTVKLGEMGGEESHTLTLAEMPSHTHNAMASGDADSSVSPQNNVWGSSTNSYSGQAGAAMNAQSVATSGGSQPHSNMQPFIAVNFCIALTGIYPEHS